MSSSHSRRRACALLFLATLPVGLLWRLAPLHLPPFALKYGGSTLWATAVYWLTAALWPDSRRVRVALLAGAFAWAVELFKLVRSAPVDHFRATLAGKLLLGRYFSAGALLAYAFAIACVACADERIGPGRAVRAHL